MKLHPDDPRLTAYLLGELPATESAAVERAAAADPAVRMALREIESVQRLLTNTLSPATSTLLPRQRENVRRSARQADLAGKVVTLDSHRKSWKPWLIPLSAAALVTLGIFTLVNIPAPGDDPIAKPGPKPQNPADWDNLPLEIAFLPAPGPADFSAADAGTPRPAASATLTKQATARDSALAKTGDEFIRQVNERLAAAPPPTPGQLPALTLRGAVSAAAHPTLDLPILAGKASLGWIAHSIREERKLPAADAVRLEEMLNAFALRPTGAAGILSGVSIATEILPCPWKPSASLLLISLRGAPDVSREITARFEANPAAVGRYRLLGFAPLTGLDGPSALPSRLPAKSRTTLAIEILPAGPSTTFGQLTWSVDGKPAPAITLTHTPDAQPSDDARFATLVCTFAQWLTRDPAALIDAEILAALARESDSDDLPTDRHELLDLIDRSLTLQP
jgi:hypothetical protein